MTETDQNFTMWQGEDKVISVALTDENGDTVDISGFTFTWKVTATPTNDTALITKTTGSGITNGTSAIEIALADTDTESLAAGTYYHECRVVDTESDEDVVFTGGLTLEPSVTA